MSENNYNPIETVTSGVNSMVGGGPKLTFIQKYYIFIKKYKFILFFICTLVLSIHVYYNNPFKKVTDKIIKR